MANRLSLSAAIITYNEEANLPGCIDSIVSFVDEIVVLDSLSTDRTEDICRNNPKIRFNTHPFDGHIEQKNRVLEKCKTDWILCIDADERVSPELQKSITNFLTQDAKVVGAKFPRLTHHMHRDIRHGGWYPNARYRLIKNQHAYWGGENPHDSLIIDGKGTTLKGDLIHYSFKDLSDQVNTINHFSSIVALSRFNHGKKGACWRLIWKPLIKFIEIYLIKKGMLDGVQGFIIAVSSSYSTFLKEAKLFELSVLQSNKPSNLSDRYQKENS